MKTENIFIQALDREIVFYIGKNQNENFKVIDMGSEDDLWFHAKDESSCHVVCEIPDDIDKKELQSIQLKKVTFKEINKTCVQVKQIIKEFKEKREHLFHQCVQIIEALIEQQKLEKIINKIKELEAKKIIKINA